MDYYSALRLAHVVGFIALGGGLLAVFVSELRAYRTAHAYRFAEAAWYTATFYDALVLPGALFMGVSGPLLVVERGLGWFSEPWLVGMWGRFLFEFIEGNTITRRQFRRTLRRSRAALQTGKLSREDREEARTWLGQITHFLDVPLVPGDRLFRRDPPRRFGARAGGDRGRPGRVRDSHDGGAEAHPAVSVR